MMPGAMVDPGAAVLQRKGGIVLPTTSDALQKRERQMARKKFLKLLKFMEKLRADHGMACREVCVICKTPVKLVRGESAIIQTDAGDNTIDPRSDAFSMTCDCTVWTVKK